MFSTPGARILKFLISRAGDRERGGGRGGGRTEPNVYGFARHPSYNHPPTAIPYFAVDIAGYRYIFIYERKCEYVYARLSVRIRRHLHVLLHYRRLSLGYCQRGSKMAEITKYYFNKSILELNPEL